MAPPGDITETTKLLPCGSPGAAYKEDDRKTSGDSKPFGRKCIAPVHVFGVMVVVMILLVSLATLVEARSANPATGPRDILPMSMVSGAKLSNVILHPHALELAQFKLVTNCGKQEFLERAKRLQEFFSSTHDAVQRSLVWNPVTDEWSDLVFWTTMHAALQAAHDILVLPAAQPFLQCINTTTLRLSHATIEIDSSWSLQAHATPSSGKSDRQVTGGGQVIEIATFPLTAGVSDKEFVKDGVATTPFFAQLHTAHRRTLAHRQDTTQVYHVDGRDVWYDFVFWTSLADAKDAARAIEKVAAARPFLDAINASDTEIFSFSYSDLMLRQDFGDQKTS
eukprot:3808930-Rhodomonas_salina.1